MGRARTSPPHASKAPWQDFGEAAIEDPHDEAHLTAFETSAMVQFGAIEMHRHNPLLHPENLKLACYDRAYAPEAERDAARTRHLAQWPDAVEMAIESLDRVTAPVARALLPAVTGPAEGLPQDDPGMDAALDAHRRFVEHLRGSAANGAPETALGRTALEQLMGAEEAVPTVDLTSLAERAVRERDRLRTMMTAGCQQLVPGAPVEQTVAEFLADHPSAGNVVSTASAVTDETIAFCRGRAFLTHLDGECSVGVAPPSRRSATAMLSWSGPYEADGPSHYDITLPEPSWPASEQAEWLTMFSETALATVTAHEVAPGHHAHGRAMRHAPGDVRRSLLGVGFAEGRAHYGEELMLEEGFRSDDPRFQIGVALAALVRVTRLWCAIGTTHRSDGRRRRGSGLCR